jgi:hypothetical protein
MLTDRTISRMQHRTNRLRVADRAADTALLSNQSYQFGLLAHRLLSSQPAGA